MKAAAIIALTALALAGCRAEEKNPEAADTVQKVEVVSLKSEALATKLQLAGAARAL